MANMPAPTNRNDQVGPTSVAVECDPQRQQRVLVRFSQTTNATSSATATPGT